MDERDKHRDLIGRFLLGAASEEERQQVEARLFAEDEFLAELQDREDALVDDYAHGRLAGEAHAAFERCFLASAEGRARVAFARAAARLRPAPAVRRWAPSWLPAAAAVVFALAAGALGMRSLRVEDARRAERAAATEREQALARQLEEARRPAPPATHPPAIVLRAQGTRAAGETQEVARPSGPLVLTVPLPTGPTLASYQAVLRTVEGALAWEDAGLQPEGATVRTTIPAAALPPGDYILTLSGRRRTGPAAELADFYFRVVP